MFAAKDEKSVTNDWRMLPWCLMQDEQSQQNVTLLQQSNLDPARSPQEMYLPTSNYAAMHVWTEILRGPWFDQIWADFEGEKEEGTSHC